MIDNQGDIENQVTTVNKYAFACAIVASMVSIVSGYGKYYYTFSILSHFYFYLIKNANLCIKAQAKKVKIELFSWKMCIQFYKSLNNILLIQNLFLISLRA